MCCEQQMPKLNWDIWPLVRSRKVFRPFHIAKECWGIEQLLSMLFDLMADGSIGACPAQVHDQTARNWIFMSLTSHDSP
jgi:hypothetical protein